MTVKFTTNLFQPIETLSVNVEVRKILKHINEEIVKSLLFKPVYTTDKWSVLRIIYMPTKEENVRDMEY